jgi:ribonuclease T1
MLQNKQLFLGIIIGLIIGIFIGKKIATPIIPSNSIIQAAPQDSFSKTKPPLDNEVRQRDVTIPPKVYTVLAYIKAHGQPMPGYVGGRVFTNREQVVPTQDASGKPITYQEWDINPKIEGQNRGTERILTGSDGRSWYTNDHYKTFTEIK